MIYRVGQKSKPVYFCNNSAYCQQISIIFDIYTLEESATGGYTVSSSIAAENWLAVHKVIAKIIRLTFFAHPAQKWAP